MKRAVEYCLEVENMNLSAIRTIRVLRPLRAINRIPSKSQTNMHASVQYMCLAKKKGETWRFRSLFWHEKIDFCLSSLAIYLQNRRRPCRRHTFQTLLCSFFVFV